MSGKRDAVPQRGVPASSTHTTDTDICPACKLHREHTPEAHAALVRRECNAVKSTLPHQSPQDAIRRDRIAHQAAEPKRIAIVRRQAEQLAACIDLLRELASYEHGKDGEHFTHSLTDTDHATVTRLLAVLENETV
jgi:hypothetical protein